MVLAATKELPKGDRNGLNPAERKKNVRLSRTGKREVVLDMGTISERRRSGGKISYCAQVVVKRKGRTHRESKTFSSKPSARAWIVKREAALSAPGALEKVEDPTLGQVIDRYIDDLQEEPGRTKEQVLRTIQTKPIAEKRCSEIESKDYIDFIRALPVKPQTRGNYTSHLSAVVTIARPAWGYPLDERALKDAMQVSKKLRLTSKSEKRDRRPTLDELNSLMDHFATRELDGTSSVPMTKVVPFALFSTRRLEEMTRIKRADYQAAHGNEPARVLVRDMKNPGEKRGNNVWCDLPVEAAAYVEAMLASHDDERVFPFNHRTIGSYFTDACRWLEIDNLHLHDLRHEGISRLFEMDWNIPRVAKVSGHRDWNSLKRYEHLRQVGDKYENWKWRTP